MSRLKSSRIEQLEYECSTLGLEDWGMDFLGRLGKNLDSWLKLGFYEPHILLPNPNLCVKIIKVRLYLFVAVDRNVCSIPSSSCIWET